jgi:hypothetical protein
LGYFTFNNSTCTWDNDGTAQPAAPEKEANCWDTLLSTPLLVRGIMMEPLNLRANKSKLLGYFYFQQFYLYWIMMEQLKPAAPEK